MSLLPALDGAFGDRLDAVRVAGESTSWSVLAARAIDLASAVEGAGVVAIAAADGQRTPVAVSNTRRNDASAAACSVSPCANEPLAEDDGEGDEDEDEDEDAGTVGPPLLVWGPAEKEEGEAVAAVAAAVGLVMKFKRNRKSSTNCEARDRNRKDGMTWSEQRYPISTG